ncbi:FAD-binding domain protein [Rhizoctonia solani]|uniref:FAD-binding domain protein n=1 Tax=Rhizoctonia solani TaxID=456999 RepID=A0A8H8NRG6_9AGAM|nr:FAD-binding domain protein [Rhizoctonia solani]QRW17403.1 FAD-binding domain protein [Rhizoctonia solani]
MGDVYSKIGEYGITVTGGRLSPIGVSGFLLGGGLSFLMNSEGFGADSVLSYEIVLADGTISTATKESSPDLFKALKGGSSNFGIVTSFKLQAYPIDNVYAGSLHYSPEQYNALFKIMETYAREGIESDPKTHIISNFIYVPSQAIEAATFYSFYPEPVAAPPSAVKPFFDLPTIMNTVKVKTFREALEEYSVGSETKQRYDFRTYTVQADSKLFKQLFDIWRLTVDGLKETPGLASGIVYQAMSSSMIHASDRKGGNVLGLKPAPNTRIIVSYLFSWSLEEDDEKVYETIAKLIAKSTGIAKSKGQLERYIYLNYAGSNQQPIESYGPAQVDFLRKVKSKYDPDSVFEILSCGGFKIPPQSVTLSV